MPRDNFLICQRFYIRKREKLSIQEANCPHSFVELEKIFALLKLNGSFFDV